ncbi:DsbA family protein [Ursidibacter arcticus]
MKIHYLFDPLCGWCYGASPVVQEIAQKYPLVLTPTGLFFQSGRKMNAEFAQYAWQNDQRIYKMTGQVFSQAYFEQVLQQELDFDSKNILLALTAVEQCASHQTLSALQALQHARYVVGQDNTNNAVIGDVLTQLGLVDATLQLDSPSTAQALNERMSLGKQLAKQFGVQGVPQLIVEKNAQKHLVPSQLLFGQTEPLLAYIEQL